MPVFGVYVDAVTVTMIVIFISPPSSSNMTIIKDKLGSYSSSNSSATFTSAPSVILPSGILAVYTHIQIMHDLVTS